MYLAKLHLQNWRSYADAKFDFAEPTTRKSVVLIGAMNGHGKTSFLISLYLGLFGRYGLRYCEGFSTTDQDEGATYRQAIEGYRRNVADSDEPTTIDITLSPTLNDANGEEIRVVRRWYFTGQNRARQGDAFEEVDVYVAGRLQKKAENEKNPLELAYERVERNLFPAHVAPAFFFDGEQAQKLIENMGEAGLKKAVEVLFGTKVIAEVAETVRDYLIRVRNKAGGVRGGTERQKDLQEKLERRVELNTQIAKLQADHIHAEHQKEEKERERSRVQVELAQMGGGAASDAAKLQGEYVMAQRESNDAEKELTDVVRSLGISLAMSRLTPAIIDRLKAEELRENWEGLKRGTLDNKEKVLAFALPEPANIDPLLGHLSTEIRANVRQRFSDALERIFNPPHSGCSTEYLLGHVKGEARPRMLDQLTSIQSGISMRAKAVAKRVREARDDLEETKAKMDRNQNLPQQIREIREKLDTLNNVNQEISRRLGVFESDIKKQKADLHTLNEEIGRIQEELARLGPEQKRIAVAERIGRALDALQERLKPTTTLRLEECVTKYFLKIADKRFKGGRIHLPVGAPPEIERADGSCQALETMGGFEKRSFGIGFSLALAEIIRRRIPLIIDTPLGNADSEYRPRTLQALTDFDLDQVIILTHDREVTPDLVDSIKPSILQKFLIEYQGSQVGSIVHKDRYFST